MGVGRGGRRTSVVITVVFGGVPKGGVVATSLGNLPVVCGPVATFMPAGGTVAAVLVVRGRCGVALAFLLLCGWVTVPRCSLPRGRIRIQSEQLVTWMKMSIDVVTTLMQK